jgi:hypothetical protein
MAINRLKHRTPSLTPMHTIGSGDESGAARLSRFVIYLCGLALVLALSRCETSHPTLSARPETPSSSPTAAR